MTNLEMASRYPEVPKPTQFLPGVRGVPESSGVYFFFDPEVEGPPVYVGCSLNLKQRITRGHESRKLGDAVSWLEFAIEETPYAEAFYIGIYRPIRNRMIYRYKAGQLRKWRQERLRVFDECMALRDRVFFQPSEATQWLSMSEDEILLRMKSSQLAHQKIGRMRFFTPEQLRAAIMEARPC
jgi:hypothetical protein